MALQHLDHETVGHPPFLVQPVEQGVVPERGPAFVHDLGLALRVEVLGDLAHDAHQLLLPGLQLGRVLLDEVQQVFLGFGREHGAPLAGAGRGLLARHGAPQVVVLPARVLLALGLALRLLTVRDGGGPLVAVHAMRRQRMAGIQDRLDGLDAVAVFAVHHVLAREDQVVEDAVGVGPLPEQVIALEEGIVAVAGVRDHQRLHRHGVLLHQVGNTWAGIDDDLVRQALHALAVVLLVADELLAVRPVRIADGQPGRGIGVEHLLGGDDFDLVGIGVQAVLAGDLRDRLVVALDQLEGPFRAFRNGLRAADRMQFAATGDRIHTVSFLNRSWNTGKISPRSHMRRITKCDADSCSYSAHRLLLRASCESGTSI
ncbi:Uncharacterised protein [Bordetella pertussis]|nr:Uncharacterised protein [Bordetella pertussis]